MHLAERYDADLGRGFRDHSFGTSTSQATGNTDNFRWSNDVEQAWYTTRGPTDGPPGPWRSQ